MFDVYIPLDDQESLFKVTLENNNLKVNVQALLDTGAEYSQVSVQVAQALRLYNGNYQDAVNIRVDIGSYDVYETEVNIVIFLTELLKNSPQFDSINKDHHIGESITVLFPKDLQVKMSVPMIIGREAIEKLGLVIQIQ